MQKQTKRHKTNTEGKILKMNYEKLTEDLLFAKHIAIMEGANNNEDGGTCNFDTPVLVLKNANFKKLEEAFKNAGLRVYKWDCGRYHITGFACGQANLRTRMVEAFERALHDSGYTTSVYYQMD